MSRITLLLGVSDKTEADIVSVFAQRLNLPITFARARARAELRYHVERREIELGEDGLYRLLIQQPPRAITWQREINVPPLAAILSGTGERIVPKSTPRLVLGWANSGSK